MGLNAVVFKNIRQFSPPVESGGFSTDPETGEVQPPPCHPEIPWSELVAVEVRIGNVAEIDCIRKIVNDEIGESLLLKGILYSGTHSGDVIPTGEVNQLRTELNLLKSKRRPELENLIADLESLVDHAERESNPIVFV